MKTLTLNLPMCPSSNGLFLNVPGRGRVISAIYQRWKDAADATLWEQKLTTFPGRVEVSIMLEDRGRFDVDNKIKAALDFVVRHAIISDDDKRIVRRITAQIGDVKGCRITITELP